jgi:Tfp pilus assembly protein PilX
MNARRTQRGATLIVATIFLILMALFAATAFKTSTNNLRMIGNMQVRQEGIAVAQKAIEQTISSTLFTTSPTTVAATPVTVDIDGDGVTDYTAMMNPQPACYRTKVIKASELNLAKAGDISCIKSSKVEQGGIDLPDSAAGAGDSMCSNSEWSIGARVADARSGAVVTVNQGVAMRVLATDASNFCPS